MKTIEMSSAVAETLYPQEDINSKVSLDLAKLFGIDTTKNNVLNVLNNEARNQIEINEVELQLAKMFGKYKQFKGLNTTNDIITKTPLSLASVLEEMEEKVAA